MLIEVRTPTKRRHLLTPRYVGDLSAVDVATPRKAKRSLQMAQETITKQRKKIKSLQQQKRRLTAKIRSLKDLVVSLKKKHLLSDEAVNTLMVNIDNLISD